MKKRVAFFLLFLLLICGVYLNRAYAHIYRTIERVQLLSPDTAFTHTIGVSSKDTKSMRYVAMGDSLTAGVGVFAYEESFPYQLATRLTTDNGGVTLTDMGVPGYRVRDVLEFVVPRVREENPEIVTLLIGTNDIHAHTSLTDFYRDYREIVRQTLEKGGTTLYLVTIPHLGSPTLLFPPYSHYFDWQAERYNRVIESIAREYNLELIDLYSLTHEVSRVDGSYYSSDFFHPSAVGYSLWADILYDHIGR